MDNFQIREAIFYWFSNNEKCIQQYGHISNWDTSKVTDMSDLFIHRDTFNENISSWNTKNVKNMNSCFFNCFSFNQDLTKWDISNVEDASYMFCNCTSLNLENVNMKKWNNVKNKFNIFFNVKV